MSGTRRALLAVLVVAATVPPPGAVAQRAGDTPPDLEVFVAEGCPRCADAEAYLEGLAALGLGGLNVKDFFAPGRGPSLGIPEGTKPRVHERIRRILTAENLPAALVAVVSLSSDRLREGRARWLKLLSGSVTLLLGIVLLLRPGRLTF